ncbi:hypothetical protein [Paenibacillus terrigena]|uniref:hypothetical protein n=1 Tax=Paenibacillus terrigena TaxID=369333 RepID=UPI00035E159E|nr:hypothetical protein [Paenibacillus terrigena]
MKKFLAGLIVGLCIFASTTVFADSIKSLVGSKVDGTFEVYYQGKKIGDAPSIDSATYLPVRKMSNIAGMNVNVEGKRIYLTDTTTQGLTDAEVDAINQKRGKIQGQIDILSANIKTYEQNIEAKKGEISDYEKRIPEAKAMIPKGREDDPIYQLGVNALNEKIAKANEDIKTNEAKITAAQAEIETLNSELSKLK